MVQLYTLHTHITQLSAYHAVHTVPNSTQMKEEYQVHVLVYKAE